MKKNFRTEIEPIECPRCHSKMLRQFIAGKMRESGKLNKTVLVIDGDSHPACQYEGRVALISVDEAQYRIDAAIQVRAAEKAVESYN